VKDRDDKISQLEGTIIDLEGRMQGIDADLSRLKNQDLVQLNNSLKEIAKMLISGKFSNINLVNYWKKLIVLFHLLL